MLIKSDGASGDCLEGINSFHTRLTDQEVKSGLHRDRVGGMWDEIGALQFAFLERNGLMPRHYLLDIGCGCMRGGLHFVRYLDTGHYFGVDANLSLLEAGIQELEAADLLHKKPILLENARFEFGKLNQQFDFGLALSVFTHLFMNNIARCLNEIRRVLKPSGIFFATYFESPHAQFLEPLHHELGGIVTRYDRDPFHLATEELAYLAENAGLTMKPLGGWGHPRNQKMAAFRLR